MKKFKRINLSFDITQPEQKRVYDIISSKAGKTGFVIEIVIAYEKSSKVLKIDEIKEAMKEVLKEFKFTSIERGLSRNNKEDNEIILPPDVFNIIDGIS